MATDATETKHDLLLEVTEPKGPAETRRQGKFQPFRRLFGRKKRREEAKRGFDGAALKESFSTGAASGGVVSDDDESSQSLRELVPIGSRALSHDSVFIPEEPAAEEPGPDRTMSQENVSDKVRNLQRQIAQGIKFGRRPSSLRKSEGDEGSSDEEEVPPRSPLKVSAQVETEPATTEPKQVQGGAPPLRSPRSRRVLSPGGTIESINLDAVPQSGPRLDNTAAKHKLSVKPKNQRVSRKHRRFTQDLQEVSIPGAVQEDAEAPGVSPDDRRRASVESLESFKKPRLHHAEERQETRRRRELEELRLRREEEEEEEGRKRAAEELRLREEEEERCRKRQEEEERCLREERRRREEEEERRRREEEERRRREKEEERRMREEEEERRRLEEQRRKRQQEEDARRQRELEAERKRKLREEEEERKREEEAETLRLKETEARKRAEAEARMRKEQEEQRKAEELRWREMEERQRPFSFKVSSAGEKQILFQKVHLTPVTPASSHQGGGVSEQRESAKAAASSSSSSSSSSSEAPESPNLPASPYVPHTAILVTGAQLCGTAVNLDQIKDTACMSLLGLGDDRRAQGTPPAPPAPPAKSKASPDDRKSGKTKSLNESSLSPDQSVLAEWASIRSKIFKGVEEGKYDPSKNQPGGGGGGDDDPPAAFSHTNLRKTMSASAKFSITPAKKKFGDSNRNSEVFGADEKDAGQEAAPAPAAAAAAPAAAASPAPTGKPQNRTSKSVRIAERGSEECVFAKDLPSFLVPSPGAKSETASESETEASAGREEAEAAAGRGGRGADGEDQLSPFGIKLRRTNFSLRFHSEQSAERRKKRYSAGDSFDGVPSPLTPIEPDDSDASSVFSDKSTSPASPQGDVAAGKFSHASASPGGPRAKPGKSTGPAAHGEGEKVLAKPPLYRRPTASSPRPGGAASPPPPPPPLSPLPKAVHGAPGPEAAAAVQRTGAVVESSSGGGGGQERRSEEPSAAVAQLHRSGQQGHAHVQGHAHGQGEEEPKERRSFFPSINIPWREKADRKSELVKKEKPSLQSRHSLDSSKVQEKEAGPLWITLALQKQKGFRDQQQNRDDRRSHREVKMAEKQAHKRDSVTLPSPTESRGSGAVSPSSKAPAPEDPKRPDSLLGRFERREQLKKANTLPSSVTVEIADSTPSPPAVKDVSKRFPSGDSPQVSTEPAWLALAKRKAKAWSDCPQIIK